MRTAQRLWLMALFIPLALAGCQDDFADNPQVDDGKSPKADGAMNQASSKSGDQQGQEAKIQANLARLNPEDRKLAEVQKWCAIQDEDRLGSMGMPVKVIVKGQPVFLCCKGCQEEALADPDKTLAKVKELRAKSLSPSAE